MTIRDFVTGLDLSLHEAIDITVQNQAGEKLYKGDCLKPFISEKKFDAASIGISDDGTILELLFTVGGGE